MVKTKIWKKFRKKPVIIEAKQWFNLKDIPEIVTRYTDKDFNTCKHCGISLYLHGSIKTLEGMHIVCPGDWVIKGVKGEFYPVKPDIFNETYEPIN